MKGDIPLLTQIVVRSFRGAAGTWRTICVKSGMSPLVLLGLLLSSASGALAVDYLEQFDGAGTILLFTHDLLNLSQYPKAERQPRIDARCRLPDHGAAQHQLMRDDLRLLGRLAQDRQKVSGKQHGRPIYVRGEYRLQAPTFTVSGTATGLLRALVAWNRPSGNPAEKNVR